MLPLGDWNPATWTTAAGEVPLELEPEAEADVPVEIVVIGVADEGAVLFVAVLVSVTVFVPDEPHPLTADAARTPTSQAADRFLTWPAY
jgi:hypothetical protein